MKDAAPLHCIRISADTLLIGAQDGRSWAMSVDSAQINPLPLSSVAARCGSVAAGLVEGAIYQGFVAAGRQDVPGPYTLLRYVRWLVGNHLFAARTPGLFRRAADRFEASGRADLAAFSRQKAAEETGHAALALRDLEALGFPAAEVIRRIAPPSARVFADRFSTHVESPEPIALFGFSYCMERMALERDAAFVRKIEAVCPPGVDAYRFLRVHSAVGSDASHVHEQLSRFASFTIAELTAVARAAFETAQLLARQPLLDQALSDEGIGRRLEQAGVDMFMFGSAVKVEAVRRN